MDEHNYTVFSWLWTLTLSWKKTDGYFTYISLYTIHYVMQNYALRVYLTGKLYFFIFFVQTKASNTLIPAILKTNERGKIKDKGHRKRIIEGLKEGTGVFHSIYKSRIQARASLGSRVMFLKVMYPERPWEEARTDPP